MIDHSGRYLLSHGRLLLRITRSEVASRYAGSLLGIGWYVLTPALLLATYSTVYLLIFKIKVPGLSPAAYVLYIFAGLVPYLTLAEGLSAGVASVVVNKGVLSNTVFPIDLAAPKSILLAQGPMVVGMIVTVGGVWLTAGPHTSMLLLPVLWLLFMASLIGVSWTLSLLNLIFRDLQNIIGVILMVLMFISPIAYTPTMVPLGLRPLIQANPFAYFVISFQRVIVLGEAPTTNDWVVITAIALFCFIAGGWFFARAKRVLIDYV